MQSEGLRLNLGSGTRLMPQSEGWINVDMREGIGADVVWDLTEPGVFREKMWPWNSDSVKEALFNHSLEHMGNWRFVLQELWRVCAPGARVEVHVPHPFHEDYVNDPTHVWCPTPPMFALLSKRICKMIQDQGGGNTPLAEILNVDFETTRTEYVLDEIYKPLSNDPSIHRLVRERFNVVKEVVMELRAVKEVAR